MAVRALPLPELLPSAHQVPSSQAPDLAGAPQIAAMTRDYVKKVARLASFLAWPMVNLHNRHRISLRIPEPGVGNSVLPLAPPNQLAMLSDYIDWRQCEVACPNQDVVYGFAVLDLAREPVVIQVPDFGSRFWVYQVGDHRTDGFADLGPMYGTQPGFYLAVGPDWEGTTPHGIAKVFCSPTNLAYLIPRVFQSDDPADKQAVQSLIRQIMVYPLSQFDGQMKARDWSNLPHFSLPAKPSGERETQWVSPETFFDVLGATLDQVPPLAGEQAIYALLRSLLHAAGNDPALRAALRQAGVAANYELIEPLFEFRNWGLALPHYWTTIKNGARFGTDYFTRAAVAKSNIFVNKSNETKYFYQDLDENGRRLSGAHCYRVTFAKDRTPPVNGFWSLTLYNQHHFLVPNQLTRFSLGTKNQGMKFNQDGSLTIYIQAGPPRPGWESNWLPAPRDGDFSLYLRSYWPKVEVTDGSWAPPPVTRVN